MLTFNPMSLTLVPVHANSHFHLIYPNFASQPTVTFPAFPSQNYPKLGAHGYPIQDSWMADSQSIEPPIQPSNRRPEVQGNKKRPRPCASQTANDKRSRSKHSQDSTDETKQSSPDSTSSHDVRPHKYQAGKATAGSGEQRTWYCGYCGYKKVSASACTDGMVRIRCPCGGVRRDNLPRMHSHWTETLASGSYATDEQGDGSNGPPKGFKPILSCKHRPHRTNKHPKTTPPRASQGIVKQESSPQSKEKSTQPEVGTASEMSTVQNDALTAFEAAINIWSTFPGQQAESGEEAHTEENPIYVR